MNSDEPLVSGHTSEPEQVAAHEENWVLDSLNDEAASDPNLPTLPVTLTDDLVPLTEDGHYVPHHLDAAGVAHWFSVVEAGKDANPNGEPYQMRYFRAAHDSQGQIIHDSYPVMHLNRRDGSPAPLPLLQMMLEDGDLENAQQLAYGTAQLQGLSFPDPTELRSLNPLWETRGESEVRVEQFHAHFGASAYQLLEPIDPAVNYSFEVLAADPWTEELTADKWWLDNSGRIAHDSLTLATYATDWPEFEKDTEHERAMMDREALHRTYREEGLEASMRLAEEMAIAHSELDPNHADGRLFHTGPIDRFTTSREAELREIEAQPSAAAWLDITDDDTTEVPAVSPEPGSWEELLQSTNTDEPEVEHHYWQLRVQAAATPDGTPLGYALFCTEFPELPPNFDEYVAEFGMDDSIYPTQARTVEMADFKTDPEAKAFSDEFRRYLIPGVIDAPELAPDVAKLEGLPGEWEAMDYQAVVDYMSGSHSIIREPNQWHLHRPVEERQLFDDMDDLRLDIDF